MGVLVPLLVVIVKLGVHLPTILRGFIFYIQISPIAVEFFTPNFRLRSDVVSTNFFLVGYVKSFLVDTLNSLEHMRSSNRSPVTHVQMSVVIPMKLLFHDKKMYG